MKDIRIVLCGLFLLVIFFCVYADSGENVRIPVKWIFGDTRKGLGFTCGDYGRKIKVSGLTRFYEVHIPSTYTKSVPTPMPVVLVFHGGGGDPSTIRYESRMDKVADAENFIVVYPAGTNDRLFLKDRLLLWNDGRPYQNGTYSTVDDVSYVVALLNDIETLFNIDKKRIYACGFSNGAQFTYRLAKRLSDRIAAIATVAGQRLADDSLDPLPTRPISIMQFAGMKDKLSPYFGGSGPSNAKFKVDSPSIKDTIESWIKFNECSSEPVEVKRTGNAMMRRYFSDKDNTEFVIWTLEDGGHTWPGGRIFPNVEALGLGEMGEVNMDINASYLMWEFFKKHSLK
jgi:polyhydroxybutyrate depolymerase